MRVVAVVLLFACMAGEVSGNDYRRFRVIERGQTVGYAWVEVRPELCRYGFEVGENRGVEERDRGSWPGRPRRQRLRASVGGRSFEVQARLDLDRPNEDDLPTWRWRVDEGDERAALVGNARFAFVGADHLLPLFPIADSIPRLPGAARSFDVVELPDGGRVRGDLRYKGRSEHSVWSRRVEVHQFEAEFGGRRVLLGIDGLGEWTSIEEPATRRTWIRLGRKAVSAGRRVTEDEAVVERPWSIVASGEEAVPARWFEPRARPLRAVLVMVSGSGAQDALGDGVPGPIGAWWRQWAHGFASMGIAVLTFDDVGAGRREGDPFEVGLLDEVDDVIAVVRAVRGRFAGLPVFVLAHSDGGWVAAIAGRRVEVDGVIEVSVPDRALETLLPEQVERLAEGRGASPVDARREREAVEAAFEALANGSSDPVDLGPILSFGGPRYWRDRRGFDPLIQLHSPSAPRFRVHGGADRQVLPPEPAVSGPGMPRTVVLPGLDHFLVRNPSGDPERALEADRRLAPEAVAVVRAWLEEQLAERE